jgi:hypothetical protein
MCPQGKIEVEWTREWLPCRFVESRQRRGKLTAKVRVGEEKVVCERRVRVVVRMGNFWWPPCRVWARFPHQATERTVSLLAGSHVREAQRPPGLFGASKNSDRSNRNGRRAVFIPPACYICVPSTGQGDWTTFGLLSGSRHYLTLAAQACSLPITRSQTRQLPGTARHYQP